MNVTFANELTPKARKLYVRAQRLSRNMGTYRRRILTYRQKLKLAKKYSYEVPNTCTLRDEAVKFCLQQLNRRQTKPQGRRFTLEEKLMALALFKSSGAAYRLLSRWFNLPSRHTLRRLLKNVEMTPGINRSLLNNLKNVVKGMRPRDRLCMLLLDEMSLLPHVAYDKHSDELIGIANGDICDHALVFMVRGAAKKWKQVVSYTFCKGSTKAIVIKSLIVSLIEELTDAGK